MNRATYFTLVALVLVSTSTVQAATTARWTPSRVATRLKTSYTTVDTVRLELAQERLDRDLNAGLPETDARVIRDRLYLTQAQTGARPDHVTCAGVGKKSARYVKFHCSAHVIGVGEYASDGFSQTVKLTVNVAHGFSVKQGWR